jgi:uncharacterized protein YbaR (Trm112 family)
MPPSQKPTSTAAGFSGSSALDLSILSQLACPACLGGLSLDEGKLVCGQCGRAYPIVDGIPVLIAGREENPRN